MRRFDLLAGTAALALTPRIARAQTLTPLRIAGAVGWTMSEGYFGRQGNFFTQAGLDVEELDLANGGAITAALVGGSVDIALTNVGSASSAYAHGLPIAIVAPGIEALTGSRPTTVIAVEPDSPIRGAHDLAGKTLCLTTLHDLQQAAVMNWIEQSGTDPKSVNYVEITASAMSAALKEGRIDAASLTEPWLAVVRPDVRAIGAPYESLGKEILLSAWIAKRSWIAANGPTLAKFVSAIHATAVWGNQHQAAMLTMLEAQTKIPHGLTSRMGYPVLGERLAVGMIQPIIDASARYGFLPAAFPASEILVGAAA
jgi:NitT/TauT family transport system substrate-binding protein